MGLISNKDCFKVSTFTFEISIKIESVVLTFLSKYNFCGGIQNLPESKLIKEYFF